MTAANFFFSKGPDVAIASTAVATGMVQETNNEAVLVSALTALIGYLVKELVAMAKLK